MKPFELEEMGQEKRTVGDFRSVEEALDRLKENPYSSLCLSRDEERYIRCDTSHVEDPCVTVRESSHGDRWVQCYRFTQDWEEINSLFAAYWQGTLDSSDWEDQVEEQLTACLGDLPPAARGCISLGGDPAQSLRRRTSDENRGDPLPKGSLRAGKSERLPV